MPSTYFKGIGGIGSSQLTEQLTTNLVNYLDWSFLAAGGYFNVTTPQSGAWGGTQSTLKPVSDPNFTNGQVWEGFRSNWVWQSGINLQIDGTQPIIVSGVKVNNTFYPTATSGTYSHYYDYPNGRVVFNTAIPTGSLVQVNYSYKWAKVRPVDNVEFMELMENSFNSENSTFNTAASGNWVGLPPTRIQLPAVFVDPFVDQSFRGWQLGGGHIATRQIKFHIFTEDVWSRNNIIDAITNQIDTKIQLFNVDSGNASWLDYRGMITGSTLTFPQLLTNYYYGDLYVVRTKARTQGKIGPVFPAIVTWDVDLYLGNV